MDYIDLGIAKTNALDENNNDCAKFNNFKSFEDLKQIFDNCNESQNIVVYHHNDNDGIFSAYIIKKYYAVFENIKFIMCDYVNSVPKEEDITDGDIVFIVDYRLLPSVFNKIVKKAKAIIWIDHHATSLRDLEDMKSFSIPKDKYDNVKVYCSSILSATGLVNELTKNSLNINYLTVKLIDMYDRWVDPTNPLPFYLNSFTNNSSDIFISNTEDCKTIEKLLYSTEDELKSYVDIGRSFYDLNEAKNKLTCDNFSKLISFMNYEKCIAVKGHGNSLLFGKDISEYDICIVYHRTITGKYKYSLFTDKNAIDVSKIAEKYGGGGHKKAAGFTINTDMFA
jgi:oligoribonuclease NrnB/cAMP/cGMP phosphodiesterase (DHH superfamily)